MAEGSNTGLSQKPQDKMAEYFSEIDTPLHISLQG